jgi:ADP-heptose:LPS heptosyltransferase
VGDRVVPPVPRRDVPSLDRFLDDPPLLDRAVRRVALVRLRVGLGDLLCSAPALRTLRRHRPDLEVTLVTWPEMAPVIDRLGHVDNLLPFPGTAGIPDRPPQPERWAAFVAQARGHRLDLALQCYGDNPAANTVAASLGARLVGGFGPTGWSTPAGTEHLHLPYPVTVHEVRRHLLLLERLGLPVTPADERLVFPVTSAEEETHAGVLGALGLEPRGYAVLHPGASSPSRRWPVASYAEVARRLHADGLAVVVTGSSSERDLSGALARRSGVPVLDLCGRTDLPGLALLLRDAAVLVGNDTGTAHLAAAVGARSVTIFQPGDPRRWGYAGPSTRALVPEVACAPCPHLECPIDFRCSRATTPDRVLSAVREVVGG